MRVKLLVLILFANSIKMSTSVPMASAQGVWSYDTSNGFIPRSEFSADTLNGKIYVWGGGGFITAPLQIFDPALHTWTTPVTKGAYIHGLSSVSGVLVGKLLVVVTFNDTIKEFDPSTLTWSSMATSGTFTARETACGAMVNGKLYVIGGDTVDFSKPVNILEVFDPSTNTWSRPATTGEFRPVSRGTCSVVDGKIYVFGAGVNVFDPSTNTWSTPFTTGIFQGADNATSSALNGKIYVFGGGGSFSSDAAQVFDPATNTWDSITSMPTARSMLSSCVVDGKIYVLGGYTPHQELNTVEVFTPGPPDEVSSHSATLSVELSPNPTDGIITVHADNTKHVTIENLLGRSVLEVANPRASEFTLDLSKLPAGLYFARFEMASGEVKMRKIVKE